MARAQYAPVDQPALASGAANDGRRSRSIVVVEHDAPLARDIESSLVRFGFNVQATVASAHEAIEAVDAYGPDLVVMDVGLEAQDDGIQAAAAIRARHPTPIVFVSARPDEATLLRAQEAQPSGYLLRPYQDEELRAAVEVALRRHDLERKTSEERSLLAGVLSGMSDAVVAADLEGHVVLANEAGRQAFGDGISVEACFESRRTYLPDQKTECLLPDLPLWRALGGEIVRNVELFIRSAEQPDGRWYSVNATPLCDAEGLVCGAVAVGRDVTELRTARWELEQLAQTDALTGAYNRWGFMRVARGALESARQLGRKPAVFFIDLNGMKSINDSLGHPEGDRLLSEVTSILRSCFRTSDIIGRLGGDEFVVLAPDAGEHAEVLKARLRAAVEGFNAESQRSYRMSISVGLCTGDPTEPLGLEQLVEAADKRMYEDKVARAASRTREPNGRRERTPRRDEDDGA